MFWILEGLAMAGQLVCGPFQVVYSVDTRTSTWHALGSFGGTDYYEPLDYAVDASSQTVLISAFSSMAPPCTFEFDPSTGTDQCVSPQADLGIAFDATGTLRAFPGPAEYFPVQGNYLSPSYNDNALMSIAQTGYDYIVALYPPGFTRLWQSVSWDADLRVLWLIGGRTSEYNFVALEPTTFTPVIFSSPDLPCWSATGAFDDVPNQTPALFVSGACPGELTVTVADASPGEEVAVLSSRRRGRARVPAGTCAGTRTALTQPALRTTLIADSFGIATTRVQATPGMCGTSLLQAVDVGSCLTTDVVGMPATVP